MTPQERAVLLEGLLERVRSRARRPTSSPLVAALDALRAGVAGTTTELAPTSAEAPTRPIVIPAEHAPAPTRTAAAEPAAATTAAAAPAPFVAAPPVTIVPASEPPLAVAATDEVEALGDGDLLEVVGEVEAEPARAPLEGETFRPRDEEEVAEAAVAATEAGDELVEVRDDEPPISSRRTVASTPPDFHDAATVDLDGALEPAPHTPAPQTPPPESGRQHVTAAPIVTTAAPLGELAPFAAKAAVETPDVSQIGGTVDLPEMGPDTELELAEPAPALAATSAPEPAPPVEAVPALDTAVAAPELELEPLEALEPEPALETARLPAVAPVAFGELPPESLAEPSTVRPLSEPAPAIELEPAMAAPEPSPSPAAPPSVAPGPEPASEVRLVAEGAPRALEAESALGEPAAPSVVELTIEPVHRPPPPPAAATSTSTFVSAARARSAATFGELVEASLRLG